MLNKQYEAVERPSRRTLQNLHLLSLKKPYKAQTTFWSRRRCTYRFVLHEKLGEYYVKVVDNRTEEVVREIPPKEWLDFYAAMAEFMGLIVDKTT